MSNTTKALHDVPAELARKIIPFVSVRDCAAYMTFLTDVFGAEVVYPPAKDPTGKVRSTRHPKLFATPFGPVFLYSLQSPHVLGILHELVVRT